LPSRPVPSRGRRPNITGARTLCRLRCSNACAIQPPVRPRANRPRRPCVAGQGAPQRCEGEVEHGRAPCQPVLVLGDAVALTLAGYSQRRGCVCPASQVSEPFVPAATRGGRASRGERRAPRASRIRTLVRSRRALLSDLLPGRLPVPRQRCERAGARQGTRRHARHSAGEHPEELWNPIPAVPAPATQ